MNIRNNEQIYEQSQISMNDGYILFRDKSKNFTCEIAIEGTKLDESEARIIIESNVCNVVFNGEIIGNRILILIKKLPIFEEGEIGKIKLEIITEDTIFVPWEEKFIVRNYRKVTVNLHKYQNFKAEEETFIKIKNIQ